MNLRPYCFAYITVLLSLPCVGQQAFKEYYERQNAEAGRLHAQKEHAKSIAILKELDHFHY